MVSSFDEDRIESMKCPKVVISDMDGTFFNSHHDVPSLTDSLYHILIQNGIPVITATGRGLLSAQIAMKQNAPNHLNHKYFPGVYHHGGCVYDEKGILILDKCLKNEVVNLVEDIVRLIVKETFEGDRQKLTTCYYCRDDLYTELRHPFIEEFAVKWAEPPLKSLDFETPIRMTDKIKEMNTVVTRLTIFGDENSRSLFFEKAKEMDLEKKGARITQSLPFCLDVVPTDVTKQEGVEILLKSMNVSVDDAVALGDGGNDVEILRCSGQSYAMGQAADAVKQSAKKVTRSVDEDGWAVAIKDCFPSLKNASDVFSRVPNLHQKDLPEDNNNNCVAKKINCDENEKDAQSDGETECSPVV